MRLWLVGWMIAGTVKWKEEMDGERRSQRRKASADSADSAESGVRMVTELVSSCSVHGAGSIRQ